MMVLSVSTDMCQLSAVAALLHGERLFQAAVLQQYGIIEQLDRSPVSNNDPFVQYDDPWAEFQHHVQVMAGKNSGVAECRQ